MVSTTNCEGGDIDEKTALRSLTGTSMQIMMVLAMILRWYRIVLTQVDMLCKEATVMMEMSVFIQNSFSDNIDNDCDDTQTISIPLLREQSWYLDHDGDGYGDSAG